METLLTADHSKRGRRFVTVLDNRHGRVTLLEPWEHAVLVLCDGTRNADEIAEMLAEGVEGEAVSARSVARCLKFFERQELIEQIGLRSEGAAKAPGARTLAGIQTAYREWHKDPVKTGQILAGQPLPFPQIDPGVPVPVGLGPTVALPDEDDEETSDDKPRTQVAIGTTFVLDGGDESGQQLRSVFEAAPAAPERPDEPATEIGSLSGEDMEHEQSEEELENVAALLAKVDDDIAEVEEAVPPPLPKQKAKPAPPPVGKAMGGVAEIPSPKSAATAELVPPERTRQSQMHEVVPEKALNPTMVGIAPEDGSSEPIIISPPRRSSSKAKAGERVGAVIGPVPSEKVRNIELPQPLPRSRSDISEGALVEDTQTIETPTEAGYEARSPLPRVETPPPDVATIVGEDEGSVEEETTSSTSEHIPSRARAVFEQLRRLGLKARSYGASEWDDETDVPGTKDQRRVHTEESREFEQALETLTSGDLEVALEHFELLQTKLPKSERVARFIEAIRDGLNGAEDEGNEVTRRIAYSFEDLVEGALAAGRCPRCFRELEGTATTCAGCGLQTRRALPRAVAEAKPKRPM